MPQDQEAQLPPSELPDSIRVPLHRLWADAGYLIGRAKNGDTELAVHTVKALCDEVERAIRAALATRQDVCPPPELAAWLMEPNALSRPALKRELCFDKPHDRSDWTITPLIRATPMEQSPEPLSDAEIADAWNDSKCEPLSEHVHTFARAILSKQSGSL